MFSAIHRHISTSLRMTPEPTTHAGDCTIYRATVNHSPVDGICTCGYGWTRVRLGDWSEMFSEERRMENCTHPEWSAYPPASPLTRTLTS